MGRDEWITGGMTRVSVTAGVLATRLFLIPSSSRQPSGPSLVPPSGALRARG